MSRTDKDRPYELRAMDPYDRRKYRTFFSHSCGPRFGFVVECDAHLDPVEVFKSDDRKYGPSCGWMLPYRFGAAPRWYNQAVWTNPERRRARDTLRNLAREYNTYGDFDDDGDYPNYQHRRNGRWLWW